MRTLYVYTLYILALSASFACSSKKVTQKDYFATDSLQENIRLKVSSATVPESRATLTIATHDLHQLPPTAVFTQHKGQATATVRYLRDTLFVEASCDSLQQLIYEYSSEVAHLQQQRKASSLKRETKQSPLTIAATLLLFLATTFSVGYILYKHRIYPRG